MLKFTTFLRLHVSVGLDSKVASNNQSQTSLRWDSEHSHSQELQVIRSQKKLPREGLCSLKVITKPRLGS